MATKRIECVEEMSSDYRALVRQLLESQGYREIMAANIFGHAIKFAPDLRLKQLIAEQMVEELEHFEAVACLYKQVEGGPLLPMIEDRLARVPYPGSWLELAMAQFLYDRAGEFHLREYRSCSFVPYARIVGKILAEEEGHEGFGERVVKEFCLQAEGRSKAQPHFDKWLAVALLSFGRPETEGNRRAMEFGLKTRDSGEVMRDFLDDIKPAMRECGLVFPAKESLGIEFPHFADLGL